MKYKTIKNSSHFEFDTDCWVFPLACKLYKINDKPYSITISFLCFHIYICLDESNDYIDECYIKELEESEKEK